MGLLAAAGFITGEALTGIGLAIPVAATGDKAPLQLFDGEYELWKPPALFFVGLSLVMLYWLALRKPKTA